MKKYFMSLCAAVAMFTLVSCESNPAIKAGEAFIKNPTPDNFEAYFEAEQKLSTSETAEYEKWCEEKQTELLNAGFKMGVEYPNYASGLGDFFE